MPTVHSPISVPHGIVSPTLQTPHCSDVSIIFFSVQPINFPSISTIGRISILLTAVEPLFNSVEAFGANTLSIPSILITSSSLLKLLTDKLSIFNFPVLVIVILVQSSLDFTFIDISAHSILPSANFIVSSDKSLVCDFVHVKT